MKNRSQLFAGFLLAATLLLSLGAVVKYRHGIYIEDGSPDEVKLKIRGSSQTAPWIEIIDADGTVKFSLPATGVIPASYVESDSELSSTNVATAYLTVTNTFTHGIVTLTGTNTTTDWSISDNFVYSLTASSTNTHSNVPSSVTQERNVYMTVSSDGIRTLDIVFGGGVTTNWVSAFLRVPRNGQTTFLFHQRGANVDISADPDGQLAFDDDAWGTGRGALIFNDGTADTRLLGTLASDTPTNGQVPKWNTGGTITWEADAGSGGGMYSLLLFTANAFNPADSTPYYIGGYPLTSAGSAAVWTNGVVVIPKSGTIVRVNTSIRVQGTLGTAEDVPHSIRLNDTTDTAVGTTDYDQNRRDLAADVSIAVAAGDLIALKIDSPAWSTNPLTVTWYCTVLIEF